MNLVLDPKTVIGDSLETAWGLKTYLYIITVAGQEDFVATDEFRKTYNAFYRVRQRKHEWYNGYYSLMEQQKTANCSFEHLLQELAAFGSVEVSFSSKLLSTIDVNRPIWDQYVLKSLGRYDEWMKFNNKPQGKRIQKAVEIYADIEQWYADFLNSQMGRDCVAKFDEVLPAYAEIISDVKKIDYMLVSKR